MVFSFVHSNTDLSTTQFDVSQADVANLSTANVTPCLRNFKRLI